MNRLFCCRNRKTSRVEVDEITDSLETCLSVERGINEFRSFLEKNRFNVELTTLTFAMKCQRILTDISRVSPVTRGVGLPERIQSDIRDLYRMTDDINFDLTQMRTLSNLDSIDVGEKITAAYHLEDLSMNFGNRSLIPRTWKHGVGKEKFLMLRFSLYKISLEIEKVGHQPGGSEFLPIMMHKTGSVKMRPVKRK